ncbi:MAG TPA: o-succinylbenzoate synthase [Kamptonema sp.]|nr:o-succinylbenzoate synthase [Kamptonema sp.]
MSYKFDFRIYQRKFNRPLQTSQGLWSIRQGIIIRLVDETGKFSLGEIAPISWLGSESFEQALDFCCQLPARLNDEIIFSIPKELPACQFGFESVGENIKKSMQNVFTPWGNKIKNYQYSGLLPSGAAALQVWQTLWNQGYRTFKWKIGVGEIQEEFKIFEQLTKAIFQMESLAFLRLDANGGLSYANACKWLQVCDNIRVDDRFKLNIEFIEQPLPVNQFEVILELRDRYSTPIALDESVATLNQMQECYQQGWRGIFVIKPCIAGSPLELRQFCQTYKIDTVFSSVFETKIGKQYALNLAAELSSNDRALGFGVNHWFEDDEETWLKHLWQNI